MRRGSGAGPIFVAKIAGKVPAVNAKNNLGLFAMNSSGDLRLILRTKDEVPTGENEVKEVASFELLNAAPGALGTARSYNNMGEIAVAVKFTDGSQALLRLQVPAPVSL